MTFSFYLNGLNILSNIANGSNFEFCTLSKRINYPFSIIIILIFNEQNRLRHCSYASINIIHQHPCHYTLSWSSQYHQRYCGIGVDEWLHQIILSFALAEAWVGFKSWRGPVNDSGPLKSTQSWLINGRCWTCWSMSIFQLLL
jgi:hypothetical protein